MCKNSLRLKLSADSSGELSSNSFLFGTRSFSDNVTAKTHLQVTSSGVHFQVVCVVYVSVCWPSAQRIFVWCFHVQPVLFLQSQSEADWLFWLLWSLHWGRARTGSGHA